MTESTEQQSTWRTKLKALGPGILMASAAVGGSHIVSSTQAGAIYGWQLALLIILINIFKYPFFRFGSQYTMENFIQRLPKWLWIEHFTIDYCHYCYYLGNVAYRWLSFP